MSLDEVLKHAREIRFSDKSDDALHQMLVVCGNYTGQVGDKYTIAQVEHAVKMIQAEFARRQREKNHQELVLEQQRLHQIQIDEAKRLSNEARKPHWTMTPIFWVSVFAMLFAALAAWPVIREWIPVAQPAQKVASSPPPQTNSPPTNKVVEQIKSVGPVVMQATNQLTK